MLVRLRAVGLITIAMVTAVQMTATEQYGLFITAARMQGAGSIALRTLAICRGNGYVVRCSSIAGRI